MQQLKKYAKCRLLNNYEYFIITVRANCFESEKNAALSFIMTRRVMARVLKLIHRRKAAAF